MKIRYISGPQSLDIKLPGVARKTGVELFVPLYQIAYGDDMFSSMQPFCGQVGLLMCPSNAQEEVKNMVRENGGFVSEKRSTEAVAEFLTQIYPNKYRDKHRFISAIYFDKDGVLWEQERLSENQPFFGTIAEYIHNCEGPFTAHPPISIATGASRESLVRVVDYIGLKRENIPAGMPWPPIVFEEGCLACDPASGEKFDLTEEKYGLFSSDFRRSNSSVLKLGREINKRVPEINKQLGAACKIIVKERSGYTLDLPLRVRGGQDDLRRAHSLIYRDIRDLIPKDVEFAGLFTKQELGG